MYINQSIACFSLICLYKVLFMLKRVELQINPKYKTIKRIIHILKRQRHVEKSFLAINIIVVFISMTICIVNEVIRNHHANNNTEAKNIEDI